MPTPWSGRLYVCGDAMTQRLTTFRVIAPPLIALATILLGLAADWLFPVFVLKILLTFYVRVTIGVAWLHAARRWRSPPSANSNRPAPM
jgi:hypothetical protein